jgi:hypothetical protein
MKILWLGLFLMSFAWATASKEVIIRGKIGGAFDQEKVKVVDEFGQSFYLPRKYFKKSQTFRQGTPFYVEVPEGVLKGLKVEVPKKQ